MTASKKSSQRATRGATKPSGPTKGFTAEEVAAMKDRVKELRAEGRKSPGKSNVDPDEEVLAKIAEMPEPDRALGKRIHAIIRATAPGLTPRLWYGMPAYSKDGSVLCFFQNASKFKVRYATLGFSDEAKLDDGAIWPVTFAIKQLTATEEAKIVELIRRAVA